jgi:hypothetical protein
MRMLSLRSKEFGSSDFYAQEIYSTWVKISICDIPTFGLDVIYCLRGTPVLDSPTQIDAVCLL